MVFDLRAFAYFAWLFIQFWQSYISDPLILANGWNVRLSEMDLQSRLNINKDK